VKHFKEPNFSAEAQPDEKDGLLGAATEAVPDQLAECIKKEDDDA
jgi:hypothetical protein